MGTEKFKIPGGGRIVGFNRQGVSGSEISHLPSYHHERFRTSESDGIYIFIHVAVNKVLLKARDAPRHGENCKNAYPHKVAGINS